MFFGRLLSVRAGSCCFLRPFHTKKIFPGDGARKETRPETIDFTSKLRRF